MNEFQLALNSIPKLTFAHRHETDHYNIHKALNLPNRFIEITYVLTGNCVVHTPECEYTVPCDSLMVSIYDEEYIFSSNEFHRHATINLEIDYEHVCENGLILPRVLSFETADNPVRTLLEEIILRYSINENDPKNIAMVYELLGKISSIYQIKNADSHEYGKERYVNRAKKYIVNNISLPFTVTDVANQLNISVSYLSHIFHQVTGQTVKQYINAVRVKTLEELIVAYGLDLKEAGVKVGLSDPDYVSRLFRKVRGHSITELIRVNVRN